MRPVGFDKRAYAAGGWRTLRKQGVGAASFCLSKGAGVSEGSSRQSTASILSNPASPRMRTKRFRARTAMPRLAFVCHPESRSFGTRDLSAAESSAEIPFDFAQGRLRCVRLRRTPLRMTPWRVPHPSRSVRRVRRVSDLRRNHAHQPINHYRRGSGGVAVGSSV